MLTLSSRQARTKKYDSRIEKVIARVARQEVLKNVMKLVYRQFLFGTYDMATNVFGPGTRVHYTGHIQSLARIQKLDNSTMTTIAPSPQPYQTPSTYLNPGTNVIAPSTSMNGFRVGDWVKCHGISINLRLKTDEILLVAPEYEHCYVYWACVACIYPGSDATDAKPDPEDVLSIPRWGFSRKIDSTQVTDKLEKKTRTIAKGKVKIPLSSLNCNIAFVNRYIDLSKNPLKVEYGTLDQNGANRTRWSPFFVIRSNIPNAAAYVTYQPTVHAVTKFHYVDS